MSQNTLKVHDLNEDAEFDENGIEVFDEKALVEEEPSDSDLAEEELLSQGATQRVLDATQLYLGEIGYSPLLTAEEEVYFARRALRGDVASRRRMIETELLHHHPLQPQHPLRDGRLAAGPGGCAGPRRLLILSSG